MNKFLFIAVFICSINNSCTDNDDNIVAACDVSNPAKDLEWLKAEIDKRNANPTENMKYCYILQAKLDNEDVFVYGDCNPLVNKVIPILDCEGMVISVERFGEIENQKVIWQPNGFLCQPPF